MPDKHLRLVYSRKFEPDDPAYMDWYVAMQWHGEVITADNKIKFARIVATRIPQPESESAIETFRELFQRCYDDPFLTLDIRTMAKTREVALVAYVPTDYTESEFEIIAGSFIKSLSTSGLIMNPMICVIPDD